MPAIETGFQGHGPGRQYAAWLAGEEPDECGCIDSAAWGDTEKEARDNLIAEIFEDMDSDHLLALVEAIEAKAQEDWTNRKAEVHSPACVGGIHIGYNRAISELMRLLDLPIVTKGAA